VLSMMIPSGIRLSRIARKCSGSLFTSTPSKSKITARNYNPSVFVQVAAGIALALVLFSIFRYAMALRSAKVARQSWRRAEESRGRRIVAEIPGAGDDMTLFLEDDDGFYWGPDAVAKRQVAGGRLRLNRGILASWSRPGVVLPEPPSAEDFEGRETWDVVLYLEDGATRVIPCGTLREGVSREIASRVFQATRDRA
jgi:hypothetical protein